MIILVLWITAWTTFFAHNTDPKMHKATRIGKNDSPAMYSAPVRSIEPKTLACIGITFKPTQEAMKFTAYRNTAHMYRRIKTVRAFLITTENTPETELDIWRAAGNGPWTVLNATSTNPHGTPFLSSILDQVERACPKSTPFVAYANADIMFDNGLERTLETLAAWVRSDNLKLMAVGRRSNHHLSGTLVKDDISKVYSELEISVAQDYFIMTRSLINWKTMPNFVIGRRAYDNVLVDWAYHHSILVDVTATVISLHQTTGDGNRAGHSDANLDKEFNILLPGMSSESYDHGSTDNAHYTTAWLDGFNTVGVFKSANGEREWPKIKHNSNRTEGDATDFRHLLILMGRGVHLKKWIHKVLQTPELGHVDILAGIFDHSVQSLECPETSERVICIQVSGTTWATGRNTLARAAFMHEINTGLQYTFWTFGDAGVVLLCMDEGVDCLVVYNSFLRDLPSEVMSIALLGSGQWQMTPNAVMVELQAYDAVWNSMRREVVNTLLPYRPEEDHNTWLSSQAILWNRLQCLQPLYAISPLFVFYIHPEHAEYPHNNRNLAEERRIGDIIMGDFSGILAKAPIDHEGQLRQKRVRNLPLIINKPVLDTLRQCNPAFSDQFYSFMIDGSMQEVRAL